MKIVYCIRGTFDSGGVERIITGKANWLAAHGHDIYIVTTDQTGRPDFFPLHEKVVRVDLDIKYAAAFSLTHKIARFREVARQTKLHRRKLEALLNDLRPDIAISIFGPEVGFLYKIKNGSKKVAEMHVGSRWRMHARQGISWKRVLDLYRTWKDKKTAARYDKFVGLTQEDMANWRNLRNVEVIPNFIPRIETVPAALSNKSLIAVGRLAYQKGYERLIAAWDIVRRHHPDWTLDIYGDGELQDALQQDIEARQLKSVITIHAPESNITARYLEHSALVLSSHYEGFGMVLLEAMACGLPVISYACPCGPRDLIKDGYNGLLVPDGDIEGLAKAIMRVINDQELRCNMGKNALNESKQYLQEAIMPRWENLFQRVLNKTA